MQELVVRIKAASDEPLEELEFSHFFADCVETHGIGRVTGSGFGFGQADLDVEVEDIAVAQPKLRELARSLGIEDRVSIDAVS